MTNSIIAGIRHGFSYLQGIKIRGLRENAFIIALFAVVSINIIASAAIAGAPADVIVAVAGIAYTDDSLYCNVSFTDTDGTWYANYSWYLNGNESLFKNNTEAVSNASVNMLSVYVPSANTSKHENWTCMVSVFDGENMTQNSSFVVINNSAPSISSSSVTTPAYKKSGISCSNGTVSDADSDNVSFYYKWYINGSIVSGQTASTLNCQSVTSCAKNKNVTCEITPTDGESNGTKINASVVVLNSAPSFVGGRDIIAMQSQVNEGVNVTFNWTYPAPPTYSIGTEDDNDNIYFLACRTDNSSGGQCQSGQDFLCKNSAQPKNSEFSCNHNTSGESQESNGGYVFICDTDNACSQAYQYAGFPKFIQYNVNHKPAIVYMNMTPYSAYKTSNISCDVNPEDNDTYISQDTVNISYFWYIDNAYVTGENSSVLSCGSNMNCSKGKNVTCEAAPYDNHGFYGNYSNFSTVILNSLPDTPQILYPSNASYHNKNNITLNLSSYDADSDNITYYIFYSNDSANYTYLGLTENILYNATVYEGVENSFYVIAGDNSSNSTQSETYLYYVDTNTPSVSFNISSASVYTGDTVTFSCSATDPTDSNVTVIIKVDGAVIPGTSYSSSVAGSHVAVCNATDDAGNYNESSISFSVSNRPAAPTGGGGGGTYTEPSNKELSRLNISNGKAVATFSKGIVRDVLDAIEIVFRDSNRTSAEISVEILGSRPVSMPLPSGISYKYISIEKVNINDSDIDSAVLRFNVNNSWIAENNINKSEIYALRYYSGSWEKLGTALVSENANNSVYEAKTYGFSVFSIVGFNNSNSTVNKISDNAGIPEENKTDTGIRDNQDAGKMAESNASSADSGRANPVADRLYKKEPERVPVYLFTGAIISALIIYLVFALVSRRKEPVAKSKVLPEDFSSKLDKVKKQDVSFDFYKEMESINQNLNVKLSKKKNVLKMQRKKK